MQTARMKGGSQLRVHVPERVRCLYPATQCIHLPQASGPAKAASSSQSTQSAPETLTKKQRQNLAKREAQKAAKAQEESERLAKLASHKRELEKSRIVEQYKNTKKTGGGMSASMNEKGQLVWD